MLPSGGLLHSGPHTARARSNGSWRWGRIPNIGQYDQGAKEAGAETVPLVAKLGADAVRAVFGTVETAR